MKVNKTLRIGQFLSRAGICSRREAADFLKQNEIYFQGIRIQRLDFRLQETDILKINGKEISLSKQKEILLLNKPKGYVCTRKKRRGQKSVYELLPKKYQHFFYAGRLDANSRGLLLFSNDGKRIYELTHPQFQVEKEYHVLFHRPLSEKERKKMEKGVMDGKDKLKAKSVFEIQPGLYKMILTTGKNREIRRMAEKLNVRVVDLLRVRVGEYQLNGIPEGNFIVLSL
ncbi:MAG: rRNA pseudouridine synthase [Candidatus Hydrogenedentota bacterium]|nr:MAG: rRNA pseudouridine synthase [Candidatus Hydrogenedentota bacterium]